MHELYVRENETVVSLSSKFSFWRVRGLDPELVLLDKDVKNKVLHRGWVGFIPTNIILQVDDRFLFLAGRVLLARMRICGCVQSRGLRNQRASQQAYGDEQRAEVFLHGRSP